MFITSGYKISNVLGSLIFHVSANPDVQELIVQEICMYEEDYNLKKLKYLEACIHETLRFCPPVLCQNRHCIQDCIINGIEVKKGTNIQLAIHASHMAPTKLHPCASPCIPVHPCTSPYIPVHPHASPAA